MSATFPLIAKTLFGLENVLAEELAELGAAQIATGRRMVSCVGDQRLLYRANICCRTAVRILKPIHQFSAADLSHDPRQALYEGVQQVAWREYLAATGSLAIDPVVHGASYTNSLYAAQVAKDAIVDQLRDPRGGRPSVDRVQPDLRINLHIDDERVTVYLDASGESLHKRGYRAAAGEAPLSEVLAAGILRLARWDRDSPLADFLCGSGTLPIEAALWARNIAPGTLRARFGFTRWKDYDRALHLQIVEEARAAQRNRLPFPIQGSDIDPRMIDIARENARRAGVEQDIRWSVENFASTTPLAPGGLLVTNPPYDERLKADQITAVYERIGEALKRNWAGYTACILAGNPDAARHIPLRASGRVRLRNGPIECRLLRFELYEHEHAKSVADRDEAPGGAPPSADRESAGSGSSAVERPAWQPRMRTWDDQAADFRNRLSRMARHWSKWARRQSITCYRLYDRDIPEIPLSIDWYDGHLVASEHDRPHGRTDVEHSAWLERMFHVALETLDVPAQRAVLKPRRSTSAPWVRTDQAPRLIDVHERRHKFQVALAANHQTGLPLDQRTLRSMVEQESAGKRFLNLFGRAGTFTVCAAAGGAVSTTTVESSASLLRWARKNMQLNALAGPAHEFVGEDEIAFLERRAAAGPAFDLAVVALPSSFGKKQDRRQQDRRQWDVHQNVVELLGLALENIAPGGKVYFLTSSRRLKLSQEHFLNATIREISRQSVPADFRDKKVHRSWTLIRV